LPDQNTATAGQDRDYDVILTLRNDGEARAHVALLADSSDVDFTPDSGDWDVNHPGQFEEGLTVIPGGEERTIRYTINQTGTSVVSTDLGVTIWSTDINADSLISGSWTNLNTIEVQDPAVMQITSVGVSQPSATRNTSKPWFITATVENAGGAAVTLDPADLNASIEDADASTVIDVAEIVGNSVLPGGQIPSATTDIRFRVSNTGNFTPAQLGDKAITVDVLAKEEPNSGEDRTASNDTATIDLKRAPTLAYEPPRFEPDTVSAGNQVSFRMNVSNGTDPTYATARLDPTTIFRIDGASPAYIAALAGPDSIEGGQTAELRFVETVVDTGIADGTYPVSAVVDYSHNGNTGFSSTISPTVDSVRVEAASTLAIQSIVVPDPPSLTRGQTQPWTVLMLVQNNGSAAVDLDLTSPGATDIRLEHASGDVTGEYTIVRPTTLEPPLSGNRLYGGETGILEFTIDISGATTGAIRVEGAVRGQDVNSEEWLTDNTDDGTFGNIEVLMPASLVVTEVRAERTTVTEGQNTDWNVTAYLQNSGGEALDIDALGAEVTFGGLGGWAFRPSAVLEGSQSTILPGGETDRLVIAVTQTGGAGNPVPIDVSISGVSTNRDTTFSDSSSASGNGGSVWVQTKADLSVDQVLAITPNPAKSVNHQQLFDIAVAVTNAGEAKAEAIAYSLHPRNGSIPPTPQPIDSITAGQTVFDTVTVTAADAPEIDDWIVARLDGALDANSRQQDFVNVTTDSDSVYVTLERPATLVINSVRTNVTSVTQNQELKWSVFVDVENTGGADLKLDTPAEGDIVFRVDGSPQTDYTLTPPDTLESGATDWVIRPGVPDTLEYVVDITGGRAGTADIRAILSATDENDPDGNSIENIQNSTTIEVEARAGLFILSTRSEADNIVSEVSYVNTNDFFPVVVRVPNSGEDVRDVRVTITSNDPATIFAPPDSIQAIADGEMATYRFTVRAHNAPIVAQTFHSQIVSAWSVNTGEQVTPKPSPDDDEAVVVQTPVDLAIESFTFSSPPSAAGGNLSTGQGFEVTARVANLGQA
jgi:hypothetical protein